MADISDSAAFYWDTRTRACTHRTNQGEEECSRGVFQAPGKDCALPVLNVCPVCVFCV